MHAFSDPDSNSGYLVTCAALAEMGTSPARFFRQFFYTYGHRNVVRAVSAGLAVGGSVDGYVYDVLRETEPDLAARTRIIRRSELLGFPPIACPAAEAQSPAIARLREALVSMPSDEHGRDVLAMLRLDGFSIEQPELFDSIAAKMRLVRRMGEWAAITGGRSRPSTDWLRPSLNARCSARGSPRRSGWRASGGWRPAWPTRRREAPELQGAGVQGGLIRTPLIAASLGCTRGRCCCIDPQC